MLPASPHLPVLVVSDRRCLIRLDDRPAAAYCPGDAAVAGGHAAEGAGRSAVQRRPLGTVPLENRPSITYSEDEVALAVVDGMERGSGSAGSGHAGAEVAACGLTAVSNKPGLVADGADSSDVGIGR